MLGILGKSLLYLASEQLSQSYRERLITRVSTVSMGLAIIWLSLPLWKVGLLLLATSLFLHIAELTRYIEPTLWTALVILLFAVMLDLAGLLLIRRRPT